MNDTFELGSDKISTQDYEDQDDPAMWMDSDYEDSYDDENDDNDDWRYLINIVDNHIMEIKNLHQYVKELDGSKNEAFCRAIAEYLMTTPKISSDLQISTCH